MRPVDRLKRPLFAALAMLAVSTTGVAAQEYPAREIRLYVGFPAGSGADIIARYYADGLKAQSGVTTIVENKTGAGGNVAAEAVVRSRPDGYSVLISSGGPASYNVHLFKKLGYDPVTDLSPVSPLVSFPFVLTVDGKSPINSVPDLVAHLKARDGKATFGAVGGTGIVMGELLKQATGTEATSVLYRNTADSINDMRDGTLDFTFMEPGTAIEQWRSGRIKALAVSTPKRSGPVPELPTMVELGFPTVERMSWFAALAPANTPAPIVAKLNDWIGRIQASRETRAFFARMSTDVFPGSPQDLLQLQRAEIAKWAELVKLAKIEPQ